MTADELEEYRTADGYLDLTMTVELNGQVLSRDSLASASWTFGELIAYASAGTWVAPGDVFGSGTCGGGCLAEIWGRAGRREPAPLSPGDVVTLTVEGIGTVSNRVVAGRPDAYRPPPARVLADPSTSCRRSDRSRPEAGRCSARVSVSTVFCAAPPNHGSFRDRRADVRVAGDTRYTGSCLAAGDDLSGHGSPGTGWNGRSARAGWPWFNSSGT